LQGIYASWVGWKAAEKEAVTTEQFVVPYVLLCHIPTWHLFLSCLFVSFTVKSGSFSSQSFTLPVTHLLQSCVFISSSFRCKRSHWQVLISSIWHSEHSVCSYFSPPFSQPFLLLLVCVDIARSLPSLLSAGWVSR